MFSKLTRPILFVSRVFLLSRRHKSQGSTSFKVRKPARNDAFFLNNKENRELVLGGFGFRHVDNLDSDQKCLFPLIQTLDPTIEEGVHRLTITPDAVINYIKLGVMNKYIGLQYCHYLAHLTRTLEESESNLFGRKCLELLNFFNRKASDITEDSLNKLCIDVADSNAANCEAVCNHFIKLSAESDESNPVIRVPTDILISVYKFGQWDMANKLLKLGLLNQRVVNIRIWDPIAKALNKAALLYKGDTLTSEKKAKLQESIWNHLVDLFDICRKERVQLITKHKLDFIQALDDFGFRVAKNITIKHSGRCTSCNQTVPLYDKSLTATLNEAIKDLLVRGKSEGLYLNTDPEEVARFQEFMDQLKKLDPKPIDCVVDGLNVAYHSNDVIVKKMTKDNQEFTIKSHIASSMTQVLVNTLIRSGILQNYRKILVIGQDHMIRWPGLLDFFKKNKIHYFFSKNTSEDDLFQLYAATLDPRTIIVTNDLFRNFIGLLDKEKKLLLVRWIDTHQSFVLKKSLKAIMPTPYETVPSSDMRNRSCFHAPIIDFFRLEDMQKHKPPPHLNDEMTMWICCSLKGEDKN